MSHRCHSFHRHTLQHKTIESVLQRGEKINDLVDRSQALSAQSKMFYKTAKKVRSPSLWVTRIEMHSLGEQQNSCCLIM